MESVYSLKGKIHQLTLLFNLYRLLHAALPAFTKEHHILDRALEMRVSAIIAAACNLIWQLLICIYFIEVILLLFLFFHYPSPSMLVVCNYYIKKLTDYSL